MLLLFAWRKQTNAVDAYMETINEEGFSLAVTSSSPFSKKKETSESYDFKPALQAGHEAERALTKLFKQSCIVSWPGVPGAIGLALWAGLILCTVKNGEDFGLIQSIRNLLLVVVRSPEVAHFLLIAMAASHVLEACYVVYLLNGLIPGPAVISWAGATLLLGFGVTKRAMLLNSAARSSG